MADNKQNVGEPDRSRVSASEDYEVRHFAQRRRITAQQARDLIAKHGDDRETLDAAAQRLKSS